MTTRMHFIDEQTQKIIAIREATQVPSPGDEIRLAEEVFYKVMRRVWCYDESLNDRCNLGVVRVT